MLYFISGNNSYGAFKKIADIKGAFLKKNKENFLTRELDGESCGLEDVFAIFGQQNLFFKKQLFILKNIFENHSSALEIFKKNLDELISADSFYILWERGEAEDKNILNFLKKNAAQVQEMNILSARELDAWLQKKAKSLGVELTKSQREEMIVEAEESAEWALENELEKILLGERFSERESKKTPAGATPSTFASVDKIFYNNFSRALLEFNKAISDGVEPAQLIYTISWKLKNIILSLRGETRSLNSYVARKAENESKFFSDSKILDSFLETILTESQLKRDSKNTNEIMERLLYQLSKA